MSKLVIKRKKVCPECSHEFKGNGWDGIDAHWKSNHEDIMPYSEAWPLIKANEYTPKKNLISNTAPPGGGTLMFCPYCEENTSCKALPISTLDPELREQRRALEGIHYFKRLRECQLCGNSFETAEVDESLIIEFAALRKKLNLIQDAINEKNVELIFGK